MARQPTREREHPRISANELAQFMVSSDTARIGIVKRSKFPQTVPIIRYRDARRALRAFLADQNRSLNHLVVAEDALRQRSDDPATSAMMKDDAERSIEVLHAIQGMGNQLGPLDFHPAPTNQNNLQLGGVEVSVQTDLLVHGSNNRSGDLIGAAILRMTADDAATDAARERRQSMGFYVATLARLHLDQNIATDRTPINRLCMSIDVQHGEVFPAPNSNARRMSDMENACRTIAALWPTIDR